MGNVTMGNVTIGLFLPDVTENCSSYEDKQNNCCCPKKKYDSHDESADLVGAASAQDDFDLRSWAVRRCAV